MIQGNYENDKRCGHNYPPDACPYEHCGYRDTLKRVEQLEEFMRKYVEAKIGSRSNAK